MSVEQLKAWEQTRQRLYDYVKKPYETKTPSEFIDQRLDGYEYANWAWMLDQMNQLHPIRSEIVLFESFIPQTMTFTFTIQVTDLKTGEARVGCGSHPVPAWDADSGKMKPDKSISNLLDNAKKAALTKSLRNAYSNFGVASDLYKSQVAGPTTEEQKTQYNQLVERANKLIAEFSEHKIPPLEKWLSERDSVWKKLTKNDADEFLSKFEDRIKEISLKER